MSVEIDIVGRFGRSGIDLEGSAMSLLEFAGRVEGLRGRETFGLRMPSAPASPYTGYLRSLEIKVGEGNVHILRDDDRVHIAGSVEKMGILAKNIASLASQESNHSSEHSHIEYYPGHFYLAEESEPLVLTRAGGPVSD